MAYKQTSMCCKTFKNLGGMNSSVLQRILVNRNTDVHRQASVSWFSRQRCTDASEKKEEGAPATEEAAAGPSEAEIQLKQENESLMAKLKDIDDKYKRSLAETENVRNRLKKQADDAKIFGIQGFCKDLLEVADTLGKAVESVPQEALVGNQGLADLYKGLLLTEGELQGVFNRHGLYQIKPKEGEAFDPNIHEALFVHAVEGKKADTVMTITKIGYKLQQRTLRPALVGVYK